MTKAYIGTTGYSYGWWFSRKGKKNPTGRKTFYPENISSTTALKYYSSRFDFVELSAPFYKLPTKKAVLGWRDQTPENFKFIVKMNKYSTHTKKMINFGNYFEEFWRDRVDHLGEKCVGVLVQMPPAFKNTGRRSKEDGLTTLERIREAGKAVGEQTRIYVEFRDPSWFCEQVYEVLREIGWVLVHVGSGGGLGNMPAGFVPSLDSWVETVPGHVMFRCHGTWPDSYRGGHSPEDMALMASVSSCVERSVIVFDNTDSYHGQICVPGLKGMILMDPAVAASGIFTPHAVRDAETMAALMR